MMDLRVPPKPKWWDLHLPRYQIFVVWLSGDLEDPPAVMSITEFCRDWCPYKRQHKKGV